jgi:hypothetical protein
LAAELLLQDPVADGELAGCLVLVLDQELEPRARASLIVRAPSAQGLELAAGCGRLAEQCELDAALDGRLAGLVRAANDREARRQLEVELVVLAELSWMRRILIGPPPSQRHRATFEKVAPKTQHLTEVGQLFGRILHR